MPPPSSTVIDLLSLPDDIFEHLFTFMFISDILRAEQCCTRLRIRFYWPRLTYLEMVPFIKTRGPLDVSCCQRLDTCASGLLRRIGSNLESLDISRFGPLEYGLRSGMESAIIEYCSHLKSMSLNNRLIDREWLLKWAMSTQGRLERVSMWMLHIRGFGGLDDILLTELLVYWPALRELDIRNNTRVALVDGCKLPRTLRVLVVQGCQRIAGRDLKLALEQCAALEHLSITYQSPHYDHVDIFESSETRNRLRSLDIDACSAQTVFDRRFTQYLSHLSSLCTLKIAHSLLTADFIEMLTESSLSTSIESLSILGCAAQSLVKADWAMERLATRMEKLSHLSLVGNRALSLAYCHLQHSYCCQFPCLVHVDMSHALRLQCAESQSALDTLRSDTLRVLTIRKYALNERNALARKEIVHELADRLKMHCVLLEYVQI